MVSLKNINRFIQNSIADHHPMEFCNKKKNQADAPKIYSNDYHQSSFQSGKTEKPKVDLCSPNSMVSDPEKNYTSVPGVGQIDKKSGKPVENTSPNDEIIDKYQVAEDEMVEWKPKAGPFTFFELPVEPTPMTKTEASLLDELGKQEGLLGLNDFKKIKEKAYDTADKMFPRTSQGNEVKGAEDGHNDAFRHAYWNALLTKRFGEEFATSYATAHEGVPGNPADKEAMDLYNNQLGRRIAAENPNASEEELAQLVADAVKNGKAVVIDGNGELAYSDQVAVGATGDANDAPRDCENRPPEWTESA
jgi:hypothetical protein